jgi:catechol 2,3-dioxygenase-like lactoylglutathione lyase family enzyme
MFDLPKPKLGDVTAITIASPDLEDSLSFYQKLGFEELLRSDFPFPLIQITDGALLIMLRRDPTPYLALTYYVKDLEDIVDELERSGIVFVQKPEPSDFVKRYLFQSPDTFNISLVTYVDGFAQPPGPTMLTMPPQDYSNPEKYVNKSCGLFGELAQPVKDLEGSIQFWQKLGFAVLSKYSSPYPWAIISDGLAVVGLHQTEQFDYPAITFFASDMKDKIEKLKGTGLTGFSEKGPGNIVLTTPEKQHINLFKLGM